MSATHLCEFVLQEKLRFSTARSTRSKTALPADDTRNKGIEPAMKTSTNEPAMKKSTKYINVGSGGGPSASQWSKSSRQWSVGTIMRMKFKIDSKFTYVLGTVTSNCTDRLSVYFIDGDKMEFKHTHVDRAFMATAMEQTDISVTLANDLLHILANRPSPESIWTAFMWNEQEQDQARTQFTSELHDDIKSLLNSDAGSERRNSIMCNIVKKFAEYHSILQSSGSIDQAVLQWVVNVAKFDCLQQTAASVMSTHPAVGTSGVAVSAADPGTAAGSHTQLSEGTSCSMREDEKDKRGFTPLMLAAAFCGLGKEAVRLSRVKACITTKSSDPTVATYEGLTALDYASYYGDAAVVEALLLAYPNLALRDRTYRTDQEHIKFCKFSSQSLGLRTNICGASSLWIACLGLHVEVVRALILAGGKALLAHTSQHLGGFLHAVCDTMSTTFQGAEARRSAIVDLLLSEGGQTLAQVKNARGETAYELVARILREDKDRISLESCNKLMALLKPVQNVGSPADECVLSPEFQILGDEDMKALLSHVPVVRSAPAQFAPLPIVEGGVPGEQTVLECGELPGLRGSGLFDPNKVCLIKFGSEISDETSAVGKAIDEALHSNAAFCNSSSNSTAKNCIPALFENVTLIARDEVVPKRSNCEVHRGKIDCENPTPAYNAEISYSQHGRGTVNAEFMDALQPGVYEEFFQVAGTIQKHVLAAMEDWFQRNQRPVLFPSEVDKRSLALLLTFPRNLGMPTIWQSDSTGGCRVPEPNHARGAKNADLLSAVPAAEAVVTRSSMLPFPFLCLLPFPFLFTPVAFPLYRDHLPYPV